MAGLLALVLLRGLATQQSPNFPELRCLPAVGHEHRLKSIRHHSQAAPYRGQGIEFGPVRVYEILHPCGLSCGEKWV